MSIVRYAAPLFLFLLIAKPVAAADALDDVDGSIEARMSSEWTVSISQFYTATGYF